MRMLCWFVRRHAIAAMPRYVAFAYALRYATHGCIIEYVTADAASMRVRHMFISADTPSCHTRD